MFPMRSPSKVKPFTTATCGLSIKLIDVKQLANACQQTWFNQTLCRVNDSVVRVGVLPGEFHWHKHDNEEEFFYVVEGRFLIDLADRSVELLPGQGFVVPRGGTARALHSGRSC